MTTIADARRSECRSCNAQIVWVETDKGKRMPLDPDPVENGNIVGTAAASVNGYGETPVVRYRRGDELFDGGARYVSHFVTCPHADQHRKIL